MTSKPVLILFGTWNVNGKLVKEDLSPWLTVPSGTDAPDLVVLGFQEFDLTPESFVRIDETRIAKWVEAIETVLRPQGNYIQVARCQLVGMLAIVYSTKALSEHISDIDTAYVGCGYTGVMGNKGGVGIRFVLGGNGLPGTGRSICFLNSHLNAHAHNVKRRQQDFESIIQRLVFFSSKPVDVPAPQDLDAVRSMMATEEENGSPPSHESLNEIGKEPLGPEEPVQLNPDDIDGLRLLDHDAVFWFGDLNYRIDLTREVIFKHIEEENWDHLIAGDQLTREMRARRVFQGFQERPPQFRPSYKYDSGTDTYDSSGKKRLPAYCDRVLWRLSSGFHHHHHRFHGHGNRPTQSKIPIVPDDQLDFSAADKGVPPLTNSHVQVVYYKAHNDLRASDHKPVSALMRVNFGKIFFSPETHAPKLNGTQRLPVTSSSNNYGYLTSMALRTATKAVSRYGVYIALFALVVGLWALYT